MTSECVLVTGASGFTGRYVCRELVCRGYRVVGLGISNTVGIYTTYDVDLRDKVTLKEFVNLVKPDYVIHLAGIASVDHANADDFYLINVIATRNLLEALMESNYDVAKVILASSANVYGNQVSGILTEDMLAAPVNDYAVSKLCMEHMAKLWVNDLPLIIVRPFNYSGVGQSDKFFIPKIVNSFKRQDNKITLGNLDVSRDFSDVRCVAEIYADLLSVDNVNGLVVNICSGKATQLRSIIETCVVKFEYQPDIVVLDEYVRQNEIHMLVGGTSLLERLLPERSFEFNLEELIEWMATE